MDWMIEEVDFLRENMSEPTAYLADKLGRSQKSVYWKLRSLNDFTAVRSTEDSMELIKRHAYVKTDKEISKLVGMDEKQVRWLRVQLFNKTKNRPHKYKTLCFYCKKATGFCRWSRDLEPVDGWEAVGKMINCGYSYAVMECPEYERG